MGVRIICCCCSAPRTRITIWMRNGNNILTIYIKRVLKTVKFFMEKLIKLFANNIYHHHIKRTDAANCCCEQLLPHKLIFNINNISSKEVFGFITLHAFISCGFLDGTEENLCLGSTNCWTASKLIKYHIRINEKWITCWSASAYMQSCVCKCDHMFGWRTALR